RGLTPPILVLNALMKPARSMGSQTKYFICAVPSRVLILFWRRSKPEADTCSDCSFIVSMVIALEQIVNSGDSKDSRPGRLHFLFVAERVGEPWRSLRDLRSLGVKSLHTGDSTSSLSRGHLKPTPPPTTC